MKIVISCLVYVGLPLLGLLFPAEAIGFKEWRKNREIDRLRRERDKEIVWVKITFKPGDRWY